MHQVEGIAAKGTQDRRNLPLLDSTYVVKLLDTVVSLVPAMSSDFQSASELLQMNTYATDTLSASD